MKLAYTSVFSYLRVAFAGTLLSAALAMAFVAVNNPGVSSASRPHRLLKKQAEYGLASRSEMSDKTGTAEDPTKAAAEDYANRAYPADDIPFSATLNAIGSLLLDPNDPTHNTIYAGTGEPNASGDSEAGVGVYKSTDGGNTWALVPDSGKFFQRSIGQMAIDNAGNLLVPIASGIRGVSSVTGGASSSGATGHPLIRRGLYRCNGTTCTQTLIATSSGCGTRGSTMVRVDPTHTG